MIDLDQSQNPIWNDNWPQKSIVNPINNETNATEKINDPDASYFARQKAPNDKYRS
ncbi:hypothetical protein SAMN05660477_02364 [Soonwooa buanensis]|uniref:Uncharacterized protein n=1 Tax=Soonwooa buanensis TaxID=619805 RepID=A0A1T5FWG0_9FLAO|nr:hypothetical protein SAMN05660477_02364 [Soonwooa buanensis]